MYLSSWSKHLSLTLLKLLAWITHSLWSSTKFSPVGYAIHLFPFCCFRFGFLRLFFLHSLYLQCHFNITFNITFKITFKSFLIVHFLILLLVVHFIFFLIRARSCHFYAHFLLNSTCKILNLILNRFLFCTKFKSTAFKSLNTNFYEVRLYVAFGLN